MRETLREDCALSDEIWSKRLKQVQEKLRSGDPEELAEIIRDGVRRDQALNTSGANSKLSLSERALFVKASASTNRFAMSIERSITPPMGVNSSTG